MEWAFERFVHASHCAVHHPSSHSHLHVVVVVVVVVIVVVVDDIVRI